MPSAHRRTMSSFSALASPSCIRKNTRNKCKQRGLKAVGARTGPGGTGLLALKIRQGEQGLAVPLRPGENVVGTHMASSRHQSGYKVKARVLRASERV